MITLRTIGSDARATTDDALVAGTAGLACRVVTDGSWAGLDITAYARRA